MYEAYGTFIAQRLIEGGWAPQAGDSSLALDIYFEKKNDHHQSFAIFHFRILTGVMRFEKPVPLLGGIYGEARNLAKAKFN